MVDEKDIGEVKNYIKNNWINCIRNTSKNSDSLFALPFSYTVPCIEGGFQSLFYWDTYFINQGLTRQGFEKLAKNNVENLLYTVNKYGFVPNGNGLEMLNRSQPPYLSMMVKDVYEIFKDDIWLRSAYVTLKKEYEFWMSRRATPIGLNRHYHHATEEYLLSFFQYVSENRLSLKAGEQMEKIAVAGHYLAEAETGWDFNPRFDGHCADFIPVDLNSNLFLYEKNFVYFSKILKNGEENLWDEKANKRQELLNTYCWNENKGLFMDYDFINEKHNTVKSLASFCPLWAKCATTKQAESTVKNLRCFEYDFGVSVCEKGERQKIYQWDYPNGWPPLFYIVVNGLMNYAYTGDAKRISQKYVEAVVKNFKTTHTLWEKYNVIDGSINVSDEYKMPAMVGWAAGVFIFCEKMARQ